MSRRREQAHIPVLENRQQRHAGDEAANVRAESHAAPAWIGKCRADQLQHKPETQHRNGGQVH